MPGACDGGNRSGGERTTVHDRGVELVAPFRGEHRTAAGIEERIVLHEHDCRLDGIKRGATLIQDFDTGADRPGQRSAIGGLLPGREILAFDHSGPAVNDDRPSGRGIGRCSECSDGDQGK